MISVTFCQSDRLTGKTSKDHDWFWHFDSQSVWQPKCQMIFDQLTFGFDVLPVRQADRQNVKEPLIWTFWQADWLTVKMSKKCIFNRKIMDNRKVYLTLMDNNKVYITLLSPKKIYIVKRTGKRKKREKKNVITI